jgi:hypothetical protein
MSNEDLYRNLINNITSAENETYIETPAFNKIDKQATQNNIQPIFDFNKHVKVNDDFDIIKTFYLNNKNLYEELFVEQFPTDFLYNTNHRILIRVCTVKEIQDYSTYDNNNPFEFRKKLDDIFRSCVIIIDNNDNILDPDVIYESDKYWIILSIREKTFPNGKRLSLKVNYTENNLKKHDSIEISRETLDIYRDEEIMSFYSHELKCFVFDTVFEKQFYIAPPTIGLKKSFERFLIEETRSKNIVPKTDEAFYRIAPYMKPGCVYMSDQELTEYKRWFQNDISTDEYAFLYDAITNQLKIGIRGLKKNRDTGIIRTPRIYPDNTKDIFFISNGFNSFIKR